MGIGLESSSINFFFIWFLYAIRKRIWLNSIESELLPPHKRSLRLIPLSCYGRLSWLNFLSCSWTGSRCSKKISRRRNEICLEWVQVWIIFSSQRILTKKFEWKIWYYLIWKPIRPTILVELRGPPDPSDMNVPFVDPRMIGRAFPFLLLLWSLSQNYLLYRSDPLRPFDSFIP